MTNATIDNALGDDYGKVVLWQYDKAYNFLRILEVFSSWFLRSVTQFWNVYLERMVAIDTADAFGLQMWGIILGQDRPNYVVSAATAENPYATRTVPVSDDMYRRILRARFFLMNAPGSLEDYSRYVNMVFSSTDGMSRCIRIVEDGACAMHYEIDNTKSDLLGDEERLVFETAQNTKSGILKDARYDTCRALLVYPAGVRSNSKAEVIAFGFAGQEPVKGTDDLNVGGFCESGTAEGQFHDTIFLASDVPDIWQTEEQELPTRT